MNPDVFFNLLDRSDSVRFDSNEGVSHAWQVAKVEVQNAEGQYVEVGGIQNPVIHRARQVTGINIFCMYAFAVSKEMQMDSRNLGFGDVACVIHNSTEFHQRIKNSVLRDGKSLKFGPITYVDRETYHGEMGPFRKFNEFEYQNEYRFALYGGNGQPTRLEIGDIRDVVRLCQADDLPEVLEVYRENFRHFCEGMRPINEKSL